MRIALALCGLALAAGVGACGPSKQEQDRKIARLERELRQAKAAEMGGPLEARTQDFETMIAQAEARHALAKLEEEME